MSNDTSPTGPSRFQGSCQVGVTTLHGDVKRHEKCIHAEDDADPIDQLMDPSCCLEGESQSLSDFYVAVPSLGFEVYHIFVSLLSQFY